MDPGKVNFIKQGTLARDINYDDFIKYLATRKGTSPTELPLENGDKLESWTMLELKSKLDEYSLASKLADTVDFEGSEEQKSLPPQPSHVPTASVYDVPDSLITKCSPVSMLGGELVKVQVVEVVPRVSKGIFKSAQNLYLLNTAPYNWKVEREYKDLGVYRDMVRRQFPGEVVRAAARVGKDAAERSLREHGAGSRGEAEKVSAALLRRPLGAQGNHVLQTH